MSKIDLIAQDIVDTIKTVPELGNRVGLAVGGRDIDPINLDLPHPAAWIVFTGVPVVDSSPSAPRNVAVIYNFEVKILTDYGVEAQMISTDLPLLEKIIETVKGSEVSGLPYHKWEFGGMVLEELNPDRLVWNISFSISTGL